MRYERNPVEELKRVDMELEAARRRLRKYTFKQERIDSYRSENPDRERALRRKSFYVSTDVEKSIRTVQSLEKQKAELEKELSNIVEGNTKNALRSISTERELNRELREQDGLLAALRGADLFSDDDNDVLPFGKSADLFISHASEDKDTLVRPLANALRGIGLAVWYDEFSLEIGDSLRESIDKGLSEARFGLVILSAHFFEKRWTNYELSGLLSKEMVGRKVILPIWHNISKDEVISYSPSLADKVALTTAVYSIDQISQKVASAVRRNARSP